MIGDEITVFSQVPDELFSFMDTPVDINTGYDIPENYSETDLAKRIGLETAVKQQHSVEMKNGNPYFTGDGYYDMQSSDGKYHRLAAKKIAGMIFYTQSVLPFPYGMGNGSRVFDSIREGEYALLSIRGPFKWHKEEIAKWDGGTARVVKAKLVGEYSPLPYSEHNKVSDKRTLQFVHPETGEVMIPDWSKANLRKSTFMYEPIIGVQLVK